MKSTLVALWAWLNKNWYVPVAGLVGLAGILLGSTLQRRVTAPKREQEEIDSIDGVTNISKRLQEEATADARSALEERHAETIKHMDADAQAEFDRLRADPDALSRHLERTAARIIRAKNDGAS